MEAINARPDSNGSAGLPRRPKGLLPSTWLGRTLRISYVDCYGSGLSNVSWSTEHFFSGLHVRVCGGDVQVRIAPEML